MMRVVASASKSLSSTLRFPAAARRRGRARRLKARRVRFGTTAPHPPHSPWTFCRQAQPVLATQPIDALASNRPYRQLLLKLLAAGIKRNLNAPPRPCAVTLIGMLPPSGACGVFDRALVESSL